MTTQASPGSSASERTCQYLTFTLGGDQFGVSIERVREILEYAEPTVIPMMPPFLKGVINLRGAVVPIVDLQSRFGRGSTSVAHRSCFVITEMEYEGEFHPLGILVDAVNEVIVVDRGTLEAKPTFGVRIRSDFVEGILNLEKGFVITLDMRNVLSIDEMAAMIALANGRGADS